MSVQPENAGAEALTGPSPLAGVVKLYDEAVQVTVAPNPLIVPEKVKFVPVCRDAV